MATTDTEDRQETTETPRRRPTAADLLSAAGVLVAASVLALWFLGSLPDHPVFEVGREVFGNIPTPLVALFYVGVAAGLWLSVHLFSLRARSWQRGKPERRTGRWLERIKRLDAGLRMKTLMRDRGAGLMHAMIYYGFLVLFAGTVTLEIDHLLPAGLKFLHGGFYQGYSFVLDLAGVVYLAGLAWAAWRRYVTPPWRIRSKTKPEDAWILATLALIGITGFTTGRLHRPRPAPGFRGVVLRRLPLSHLVPAGWEEIVHRVSWVVHAAAFVAFLVVLPTTKLRHMFTSPANLFLQPRERPKGAMRELPNLMEVEDIDTIGASVVEDLTWKQIFDTDACTICGRCTSVCPANLTGKPLDPREMVLKTGEVAAATAGVSPPVSLDERITIDGSELFQRVQPIEAWSCTTCKAWTRSAPSASTSRPDPRHAPLPDPDESDFPSELESIRGDGEPGTLGCQPGAASRLDEGAGLRVPVLGEGGARSGVPLVRGLCRFVRRPQHAVSVALARLLHRAGISFILGPRRCATATRPTGRQRVRVPAARPQNIETFEQLGVKKIITQCPHCFNTLANEYPQFGGEYEVVHHAASGRAPAGTSRCRQRAAARRVTYHDPVLPGPAQRHLPGPREWLPPAGRWRWWRCGGTGPGRVLRRRRGTFLDGRAHRQEGQHRSAEEALETGRRGSRLPTAT